MFDVNGTNTTNVTLATSYVYHVVTRKLISTVSVSKVLVAAQQTQATVSVELPSDVQLSSAPLSGKFRITCPLENNDLVEEPIATADIKMNEWDRWIM